MNRIAMKMAFGSFALLLTSSALAAGDFSRTCRDVDLHRGSFLTSTCKSVSGRPSQAGIQLNNYIANINGNLRWRRNGNFIASSRHCELDFVSGVTVLLCDTRRANGSWTSSLLTLDERIANLDGALRYERPARGHDEL